MSEEEYEHDGGSEGDEEHSDGEMAPNPTAPGARQAGKFSDAFSKILGKRKTVTVGGLERLEQRAQKSVKAAKTQGGEEGEDAQQLAAREARNQRKELKRRGHLKPTERGEDPEVDQRERHHLINATRGVVRLFNAVRKAQRELDEDALLNGGVAQTKSGFLSELKGKAAKGIALEMRPAAGGADAAAAAGSAAAGGSTWEVFREDFLTGRNRLKDWDKGLAAEGGLSAEMANEQATDVAQRMDAGSDDSDF